MRTRFLPFLILAAVTGCGTPQATGPADIGPGAAADRAKMQGVWSIESFDNGELDKLTPEEKTKFLDQFKKTRLQFQKELFSIIEREQHFQFLFTLDTTQDPRVLRLTELYDDGLMRGGSASTARSGTYRGTAGNVGTYRGTAAGNIGTSKGGTSFGTNKGGTYRTGSGRDGPGSVDAERVEWIYKFDGDTLVIALTKGSDKRPTEFKPQARSGANGGVTVVKLKKTDEAFIAAPTPRYSGTSTSRSTAGTKR